MTTIELEFGLKKEVLRQIISILAKFTEIEEVILYGSRALGTYKGGSDIDLTLKGESLDTSILNKIGLLLDDLYLPYTFDLSVYEHIKNADLLEHIKRHGVTVYKKG